MTATLRARLDQARTFADGRDRTSRRFFKAGDAFLSAVCPAGD